MGTGQRVFRAAAVGALAAVAVTTVAAAPAAYGTAPAAPRQTAYPAFLAPEELPPHRFGSPWYAGEVTGGLPEYPVFCLEKVLPPAGSSHREFWTDYETGALQVTVEAAGGTAASRLAARVEESVRDCAADHEKRYPGADAEWRDHGVLDVEEGAHLYGVGTSHPDSEQNVHLFGVGRDDSTVTVVLWGEMGTLDGAPVDDFARTVRTAVAKLHD